MNNQFVMDSSLQTQKSPQSYRGTRAAKRSRVLPGPRSNIELGPFTSILSNYVEPGPQPSTVMRHMTLVEPVFDTSPPATKQDGSEWFDSELIKFTVCYEIYDDNAITLPCGHNFCRVCIDNLVAKTCPNCRKRFKRIAVDSVLNKIAEDYRNWQKKLDVKAAEQLFPMMQPLVPPPLPAASVLQQKQMVPVDQPTEPTGRRPPRPPPEMPELHIQLGLPQPEWISDDEEGVELS